MSEHRRRREAAADMMWDVLVVGAGPAGCAAAAAALQAQPGANVLLLDRASFPRDKPCGDGIAGLAVRTVAALGLDASTVVAGYPPVNGFRVTSSSGVCVQRVMREPVWVIPRLVFDDRLVTQVCAQGATLVHHRVRQVDSLPDHIVVDGRFRARILIGADGAESTIRRTSRSPRNPARATAVAIRGYGPELPDQDGAQIIAMSRRNWPAYAWSFPVGGGQANLGYGRVIGGEAPTRHELIEQLGALLPAARPDPETLRAHRLPLSTVRPHSHGRTLLVGDAHSLINPITGEGIYYALVSGALAGRAAVRHPQQAVAEYRRALQRRLGRYLRHSGLLARIGRVPAVMDAALRGARDDQRVFDDLVDLGLHDGHLTPRLLRSVLTA